MSGPPIDADDAARLIERLLLDAELRERFRRDPVRVCQELGFAALADELAAGAGNAAQTLDLRESRSSLAGVLMAAAIEGVALAQVIEQARNAGGAVAEVARRVTLPELPSLPDPRGGGGAAPGGRFAAAAGDAGAPAGSAPASQPMSEPADVGGSAAPAAVAVQPAAGSQAEPSVVPAATAPPVDALAPTAAPADAPAPTSPTAGAPTPQPASGEQPLPAAPPTEQVAQVLARPELEFDEAARATLLAGRVPPPAVALLDDLAAEHRLAVRIAPQHAGVVEITAIDGEPVRETSIAARDLAERVAGRPTEQRPVEIATPWRIDGAPFVRDPAIDDRLRLTFAVDDDAPAARDQGAPPADTDAPVDPAAAGDSDATTTRHAEPPAPAAAPAEPPAAPAEPPTTPTSSRRPAEPVDGDDLQFAEPTARRADAAVGEPRDTDDLALPATDDREPVARRSVEADASPPTEVTDYPGDDAPRRELAAWMATKARERGLPPELPVMAALVESGLQNLNYGDRDSVGFFQMRLGIWNSGAYRGYPERPELQLKWFLDHAVEVRDQRIARGLPIDDPSQYGTWIADVERPAEQYRGRYQLQLDEARELLQSGGNASAATHAEHAPAEATHGEHPDGATVSTPSRDGLAEAVLEHPRLQLDEVGQADVRAGRLDPRVLSLLLRLADDHDLRISCTKSDHSQFTAGGSVSNHFHGRAFDVAFVDGEIVNGASPRSRALAEQLATLPASIRPDEIGTPWPIAGPGYFTDAGHQDHLHVGFKTALPEDWAPPASVAVPAAPEPELVPAPEAGAGVAELDDLALAEPTARRAGTAAGAPGQAADLDTLSLPVPPEPSGAAAAATGDGPGAQRLAAGEGAKESDAPAPAPTAAPAPAAVHAPTSPVAPAGLADGAQPSASAGSRPPGRDDDDLQLESIARRTSEAGGDHDTLALPVPAALQPARPMQAPSALEPASLDALGEPGGYPGDDAGRPALARWLGAQARRHGLPPELPVMAALVESGLQNLNYGDRDSVGFFQMRTGIWNTGAYRGYPERADLQARWFIDQALAVRRARIAAGDAEFGRDASTWGEWIADVERPAEQYRGRYQLRLAEARRLLRGE